MKASIAMVYVGLNITGSPTEPDGVLRYVENKATREVAFKKGNPLTADPDFPTAKPPILLFPAPTVPPEVAIELCERGVWKCVDKQDQADVDAAIADKLKALAEKNKPQTTEGK